MKSSKQQQYEGQQRVANTVSSKYFFEESTSCILMIALHLRHLLARKIALAREERKFHSKKKSTVNDKQGTKKQTESRRFKNFVAC